MAFHSGASTASKWTPKGDKKVPTGKVKPFNYAQATTHQKRGV